MKAAFILQTGRPDVLQLGELPTPQPKPREIRVRVAAASVNPIDTYIRGGMVNMNLPQPFIPGCDFAGTVDSIGSEVQRFQLGQRVWGSNQGLLGRQGTFAEYCCVEEQWAYPLPDGVSEKTAAASALVGITAHLGLFDRTELKAGETLFVNGGSGGVGLMVVQMAKAVGAKVITTVGSSEKAALVQSFGADHVINYKTEDVTGRILELTGQRGVQVWYETQPPTDLEKTIAAVAQRGRIVVMAGRAAKPVFPNGAFYVKGLSLFGFAMFNIPAEEQQKCAADINRWLLAGQLKAHIGAEFRLDQTREAHQLQEDNTLGKAGTLTGKIVVLPG